MKHHMIWILIFCFTAGVYAQYIPRKQGSVLTGKVRDALLDVPVEYANIVLYEQGNEKQITGSITNSQGIFMLNGVKPGTYHLKVKFIGYYEQSVDSLQITPDRKIVDVGTINLDQAILMLEGVQVEAEKAPVEYKIDRKVINVEQQITASGGSAADVLENVPSITVDIEGNVQLRGSSSFTVLIDNRPTLMDASDALQQIPASTIENIEIITNPSAKYEPDGVTGIVNIITKKNSLQGLTGIFNMNSGVDDKYGADFLLNYRVNKINAYMGMNYNHRYFPGDRFSESITTVNDTSFYLNSAGRNKMDFTSFGFQAGVDYELTQQDNIKVGVDYRHRQRDHDADIDFDEWYNTYDDRYNYSSYSESERGGPEYAASVDYMHEFAEKGHELTALFNIEYETGDELSINENLNSVGIVDYGKKSVEKGPSSRADLKVDYTRPIGESMKFEAGYQGRFSQSDEENELHEYNTGTQQYEFLQEYSYLTHYDRNIHAIYTMYAGEIGKWGYQGGLRGEYTDRKMELENTSQVYTLDRWDLFPTAHMSYALPAGQEMMLSYTRRIDRPRGYYFEPFLTWVDAYNVRQGNPAIKPEYIDSWELGYQKHLGRNLVSVESYYRITNDRVERIQSVYTDNIILQSVDNVGKDYALGAEFMINWDLLHQWNVNLMGNVYDYRVEGQLLGEDFSRSSFNWNTRFNNTLKLGENSRLQFNVMYNSPSVSAQGRREGFIVTGLAYRQELMDKQLSLTLRVRDLFGTGKFVRTSEGNGFYSYTRFERDSPMFMMSVSYKLNNYKAKRNRNDMNGDYGGVGEDMEGGY